MINIRQKGFDAERDIANDLNIIVHLVHNELGLPPPLKPVIQRNQLQSAVGGKDLVGTFGLAIEVKRQEALSINTWWAQCVKSAHELNEVPVLLFRQNKQKWRCILDTDLAFINSSKSLRVRSEISYEDFKAWFKVLVRNELKQASSPNPAAVPTTEGLFGSF
jgi:hypothetical protein